MVAIFDVAGGMEQGLLRHGMEHAMLHIQLAKVSRWKLLKVYSVSTFCCPMAG